MGSVYFCSDLHLGHKMASKLRGFDDVHDHDNHIIDVLEKTLNKRDKLIVIGDAAMSLDSLYFLGAVNCHKTLVFGNHDLYKLKDYLTIFDDVHGFYKYKNMWVSHCPIHPQEMWRCEVNLHGHLHKGAATPPIRFPYINMNWDWWGRPVDLNEIKDMVSKKEDEQDRCATK